MTTDELFDSTRILIVADEPANFNLNKMLAGEAIPQSSHIAAVAVCLPDSLPEILAIRDRQLELPHD